MLLLSPSEWLAGSGRSRLARGCWTLAWATYLVHVAMAFHHYHHWSHVEAVAHTREVSGFAPGVRRELWIYLLLAAALVTAIEWATYHRRLTV